MTTNDMSQGFRASSSMQPASPILSHGPSAGYWCFLAILLVGNGIAVFFLKVRFDDYYWGGGHKTPPVAQANLGPEQVAHLVPDSVIEVAPVKTGQLARQASNSTRDGASRGVSNFDPSTNIRGDARQIDPVQVQWLKDKLNSVTKGSEEPATLQPAIELIEEIGNYPYFTKYEGFIDPSITEKRHYGDCAAKSLWLATKLIERGYSARISQIGMRIANDVYT